MDNVEIVQSAYEAFARGDVGGVLAVLDPDVTWSAPLTLPQGGTFTGPDGVATFFAGIGAAWESLSLEMVALGAVSADRVVGVVRGSGRLRVGAEGAYGATHVFTLASGKVVGFDEYTDLDAPLPR